MKELSPRERLEQVEEKISAACRSAGRKRGDVKLIGASKTKTVEEILALADAGLRCFGENYVQEGISKVQALSEKRLEWHFIGVLQSNKAKFIPGNFDLFHGLDSLALAKKLDSAAQKQKLVQDCLIEINLNRELTKGGIPPHDALQLLESLNELKNVRVTGLMCIPNSAAQLENPRKNFAKLRELLDQLNSRGSYKHHLCELSMGMSADYEDAIREGATIIRLGTALFGERKKKE